MAEAVASRRSSQAVVSAAARTRIAALPLAIALLSVFALVLRLAWIDRESLWLDEGYTLLFSRLPFPQLLLVGGAHEHPPFYYVLVHLGLQLWHSYLVPRVISAVAGALSVPVLWLVGRKLFSSQVGLVAAALLAVAPFHLWYSQDGRAYELAGLFVLLSYLFLLTGVESGERWYWALYVLATALALYTEYMTVLVLLPQALFLLRTRRPLLLSWLAVALLFAPWLGVLLRDTMAVAGDYWIPPPTASVVANTLLEFAGLVTPCPSPPCSGKSLSLLVPYGMALGAAVGLTSLAALAWGLWRRNFPVVLLGVWLVLPFAVVVPLSAVRSLYLDRVFLDATFPLYLLLAFFAVRLAGVRSAAVPALAILALLLVGNGATLALVYTDSSNPDWRSLARDLRTAYRPGQAVMFNPGVLQTVVDAYLPSGWKATRQRALWSRSYLDVPGWQKYYPIAQKTDRATRTYVEAVLRSRQLADVSAGVSQVWLVTHDYPGLSDSRRWFIDHGFQPLISQLYAGDTRLELWSRTPPSSLGPAAVAPQGFPNTWTRTGRIRSAGGGVVEDGPARLIRSWPVRGGAAYSVNVEYHALPPAGPSVSVRVFDARGRLLDTFPRTQWYALPVTGVWLSQPFGFVAPPGAARAELTVENGWGQTTWRRIAVFQAPPCRDTRCR